MSAKQKTINSFQEMMEMDIDVHQQKHTTVRFAINGRILFNNDSGLPVNEASLKGTSFAFVNDKGTKILLTSCDGFECIGGVDSVDECISMWTDGTNSQIRTFKIDDSGVVYDNWVLFDDRNDPNGDKLNFSTDYYIEGRAEFENEFTRRIYFWDNRNYNQPRAINIELFLRSYIDHSDGNKIKKRPIHWQWNFTNPNDPQPAANAPACGANITYERWLSVHSFDWNSDLIYPTIKFYRRLLDSSVIYPDYGALHSADELDYRINERCSLKTGIFQYFVRYVTKDGFKTPISPLTNHIFLTSMFKNKNNHHDYTMYASNVVTSFGTELIIKDIDTRFYKMEIGFVFSIDKENPSEYTVFKVIKLQNNVTSINVNHINHSGIPLSSDDIIVKYQAIMGVNTGGVKENKFFLGGITGIPDIKINTSNTTIKPFMRSMHADETFEPLFTQDPDDTDNPIPATNSTPITKPYTINKFTGETETFEIYRDYDHYKGMQFEHLFKGYWKGEIYGIGAVALDRKGNPLFVQYIEDFKFPEMYEAGYNNITDTPNDPTAFNHTFLDTEDGFYKLKIMGMLISGIRIPKDKLYDKFGKLNISGFMIVRSPRNKRILHQGLILNCVYEQDCKADKDADDEEQITRPLPHLSNKFKTQFDSVNSNLYGMLGRCAKRDNKCKQNYLSVGNRPHQFTYESPDMFVSGETLKFNASDYIKLVGTCHKGYINDQIHYGHDHVYTKSIKTNNDIHRYPLGLESRVQEVYKFDSREQRKPYDKDFTDLKFTNDIWGIFVNGYSFLSGVFEVYPHKVCTGPDVPGIDCFPTTGVLLTYYLDISTGTTYNWDGSTYVSAESPDFLGDKPAFFSSGHKDTTVLKCKDFMHLDIIESNSSKSSYHIVNYLRPNETYYTDTDDASLEIRQYISTGHYQKIDASILTKAKKVMKNGSIIAGNVAVDNNDIDFYQFDDIEVWGGDTFLQFTDFTRLMPYYVGACEKCDGMLLDYAVSMIVPLECSYNLMMRYGRTFAKSGTQAQAISCNNVEPWMKKGIMDRQPEDWNVNSALQHQNNLQIYQTLPYDIKITSDMPTRIYSSLIKTYSELEDRYRKMLRLNYYDLPGVHGEIIAFAEAFNNIYCWQEKAYGGLRINERVTGSTDLGAEAVLGTGLNLDGIEYISTIFGCQHRVSLKRMNGAIYWVDARMGKHLRFAQDGNSIVSDGRSGHDIMTNALPYFEQIKGIPNIRIIGAADYTNNDIIYTFISPDEEKLKSFTISYNETLDKYHSYHVFTPKIYLHHKKFIISPDPLHPEKIYVHGIGKKGHYYDVYHKTIFSFVVNENFANTKVMDNMLINVNKSGYIRINKITFTTQNQIHVVNLKSDRRVKYIEDKLRFPIRQDEYENDRVRGHYMIVTVEIDNEDQATDGLDIQTVITSIETEFRYSHKI